MTESKKKKLNKRVQYFNDIIMRDLSDYFDVRIIAPKQFRIMSRVNDKWLDYYPQSMKAFAHKEKKWGLINMELLVEKLKPYLKTEE